MTPMRCARELASFLQEKFDGIDYCSTDEKLGGKPMHVYAGFLPRAMNEKDKLEQDPCVVIRPVKVNDLETESEVELQLLVCTYNRDLATGHMELYHALELCRQWICQTPVVNAMFRLKKPMETGIPEEQGFPEWLGYMKVTYTIGAPGYNIAAILKDEKNFM